MPFLGSAFGLTAMCSPGWGNLVAFDWNNLPVGREFGLFNEKSQIPTLCPASPPPPIYIDRCIIYRAFSHDVMSAMLGSQTSPVGVQHFSHVNAFFGSNTFAYSCCPHELKCSIRWIALSNFGAAGTWVQVPLT